MAAYGVGITPLFQLIRNDTKQAAFADDLSGAQKLIILREWWANISTYGPPLGYFPNASKTWLVVKPHLHADAARIFEGTGIKITVEGRKHLGGFVGSREAEERYAISKIEELTDQVLVLAEIAKTEPHAAYAGFNKGFIHKLNYHIRVIPEIGTFLASLDQAVQDKLIPAFSDGYICSEDERLLLSLPIKSGGMSIPIFETKSTDEYQFSRMACSQLIRNIKSQTVEYLFDMKEATENREQTARLKKDSLQQVEDQVRQK